MLAGRVWFNGMGAYALAAPAPDRTFDWTTDASPLVRLPVHETLTHLMLIALPLGFLLAWLPRSNRVGKAILVGWCILVALLGAGYLVAAVLYWQKVSFGDLPYAESLRIVIPAVTAIALGMQSIFSGFLLAILNLPRRDTRPSS